MVSVGTVVIFVTNGSMFIILNVCYGLSLHGTRKRKDGALTEEDMSLIS